MHIPTAQQHQRLMASIPLFGLLFALVALIFCLTTINLLNMPIPFLNAPPETGIPDLKWPLYLAATLGALFSSMFFWWLLIVLPWSFWRTRSKILPLVIGGLTGLLSTLGAHFLMWIIWTIWGKNFSQPVEPPTQILVSLFFIVLVSLVLSLFSLLIIGISSLGTMFLFGIAAGILGVALLFFWTGETGRPQSKPDMPSGTPPLPAATLVFFPLMDEQPPLYEYPPADIQPFQDG